jgi:membrane-associated phospholipid phosphatase
MLKNLCKIYSYLLHPYLVPLYVVVALLFGATTYALLPLRLKFYLLWVFGLYTLILPVVINAFVHRLGNNRFKRWFSGRRRRILPLMVGACCYLLCAITLMKAPSLLFFRKMAIAAVMCEVFCLVVLPLWRVSLHMTAMGAVVAIFIVLNVVGVLSLFWAMLLSIVVAALLASARLYIGRNNGMQVLVGFCAGFIITVGALLMM